MNKKIVAMVPARSGSEGLPDKNIKPLGGKPLIAHSIEPAVGCADIVKTYINSDSQAYLDIGEEYGAVPFKRDSEFSTNTSTMQQVVENFIETLQRSGEIYDAVLVLYPTYPFRTVANLSDIIKFYYNHPKCSSIIGLKSPDVHPYLCANLENDESVSTYIDFDVNAYYRRQDYPECYQFTAWSMVAAFDKIHRLNAQMLDCETKGYVISDHINVVDIDTLHDFNYAEFLIQKDMLL